MCRIPVRDTRADANANFTIDSHPEELGHRRPRYVPPHLRHSDRLTFGVELEMILEGHTEADGCGALVRCLQRLFRSGGVAYDAELQVGAAHYDRTKFLIMADHRWASSSMLHPLPAPLPPPPPPPS